MVNLKIKSDPRCSHVKIMKYYDKKFCFYFGTDIVKKFFFVYGEGVKVNIWPEDKKIIISPIGIHKMCLEDEVTAKGRTFQKVSKYFYRIIIEDKFFVNSAKYLVEKPFYTIYCEHEICGNSLIIHTDKEVNQ
jgi:hypothetical protein